MQLAEDTTPLVLPDGTVIDPITGSSSRPRKMVEVPSNTDAQKQITKINRTLTDLPLPSKDMNAIALVAIYTIYGLSDDDIAVTIGAKDGAHVGRMKTTDAYMTLYQDATSKLVESNQELVRDVMETHSSSAARKMVELIDSENEGIALKAATDVLDRSGHRPADIVEHRHKMEGGLVIKHISRTDEAEVLDGNYIDVSVEDA